VAVIGVIEPRKKKKKRDRFRAIPIMVYTIGHCRMAPEERHDYTNMCRLGEQVKNRRNFAGLYVSQCLPTLEIFLRKGVGNTHQ
jgi:hypothetical protein